MADKKISQLASLLVASGNDVFPIVDDANPSDTMKISVSDLMGSPGPIGGNNANKGIFTTLKLPTGSEISEFSTDVTLSGNSDTVVPTEKAVKTYVDNKVGQGENVRRISTDSTAVALDIMLVDSTAGNVTITIVETNEGKITVKKISEDTNIVTIKASGQIDDQTQFTIVTPYQTYTFLVDNGDVFVL